LLNSTGVLVMFQVRVLSATFGKGMALEPESSC
jgi:hypothetical protein